MSSHVYGSSSDGFSLLDLTFTALGDTGLPDWVTSGQSDTSRDVDEMSIDTLMSNCLSLSNTPSADSGLSSNIKSTESNKDGARLLGDMLSVCENTKTSQSISKETEVFRFTDLPSELRNLMYSYFLSVPPGEEFQLDHPMMDWDIGGVSSSILKVSKAVYREAFPVFLMQNRFLLGSSITNTGLSTGVFDQLGVNKCRHLQHLSVHLNGRTIGSCVDIINAIQYFCVDLRRLELRVSPGSPFLPDVASMLRSRSEPQNSIAKISLRLSIMKAEAVISVDDVAARDKLVSDIDQAFKKVFRWPQLLGRLHEITIKGSVYPNASQKFETLKNNGWEMEKTNTIEMTDCEMRDEFVVRTWEQVEVLEVDEEMRESGSAPSLVPDASASSDSEALSASSAPPDSTSSPSC